MASKPQPGLADYVGIAVCPILIMALVCSLVYFLLDVLYEGQYYGRLQYILFFFVFAAVLIARISMDAGLAGRSTVYGLALGAATFVALQGLVEYPEGSPLASFRWAVNLGLMALIWWCAHRLTWDCTYIDENVDASGAGLLEAAGLEAKSDRSEGDGVETAELEAAKGQPSLFAWWDRYGLYREEQKRKPHTPGVWIVYFSLAALPLFGLGQALIPPNEESRRAYAFWLLGVYVASGLGLLLTTSFLGLRRYLRQRNLEMPGGVTRVWLTIGIVLIVLLLAAGAFLPRPYAEYPLVNVKKIFGSPQKDASKVAVLGGSPGKGEGGSGHGDPMRDPQGNPQPGANSGEPKGENGQGQGQGQPGEGQNPAGDQGQGGNNQSGEQPSPGQGNQAGQDQSDQKPPPPDSQKQPPDQNAQNQPQANNKATPPPTNQTVQGKAGTRPPQEKQNQPKDSQSSPSNPLKFLSDFWKTLGKFLKWLVLIIGGLVAAFFLVRAVLKFLGNFTGWAQKLYLALQAFWQRLFSGWGASEPEQAEVKEVVRPPRRFSSYHNPFLSGMGGHTSNEELVRYSFEALEAWGREHQSARQEGETVFEFAGRVGEATPALEAEARRLAVLYARAAYGRGRLPNTCLDHLEKFWRTLEAVAQSPMSAGIED